MPTRVVVIGGGVAGASAAYRAAATGSHVTLVDSAHEGQATAAGAGIVSHAGLRDVEEHWYRFFCSATAYYADLVEQLKDQGEDDIGYKVTGQLVLAPGEGSEARLEAIARRLAELSDRWHDRQIGEVRTLQPSEARELFPPLHPSLGAVHASGVARVDGRLLREALTRTVVRLGGQVMQETATLQKRGPGRPPAVEVAGELLDADAVIVAGGAWSNELLSPLGRSVPLEPQKGQIAHLRLPGTKTDDFPVVSGYESDYMVSFPPDRVVAGATREEKSGFDYRMTAGGVEQVLSRALAVAPGLSSASLEEVRIGFRPASADGFPILGALDELFVSTGFGPSGLTLAPYASALVAAVATGDDASDLLALAPPGATAKPRSVAELLEPFSPDRFAKRATS